MSTENPTYLEQELGASITKEDGRTVFTFQKEKIKLDHRLEIDMIKEIDPSFQKEIVTTDDELMISIQPPSGYRGFRAIHHSDERSKWLFAHHLVEKVKAYRLNRLHLIVCPENIVLDRGLEPYFLHYGVAESIPPYEKDEDRLWRELKATVATAVDGKYSFNEYFDYHETLKLSSTAKEILDANSIEELQTLIQGQIVQLEKKDKTLVHIPEKKWKIQRYVLIGILICLVPAVLYVGYSIFFLQPKQKAFAESSQFFLSKDYSQVVDTLDPYKISQMPKVVQYELATSYVVNVSLSENQRKNVRDRITLQSDPQYYEYWIHIGRGEAEEALDIARSLEDRDLIMYALLQYNKQLKADDDLSGEEKQKKIDDNNEELDKLKKEMDEQKKQEQNADEGEQGVSEDQQGTQDDRQIEGNQQDQSGQPEKVTNKEKTPEVNQSKDQQSDKKADQSKDKDDKKKTDQKKESKKDSVSKKSESKNDKSS